MADIYLKKGQLHAEEIIGEWIDAGTFESLYKASTVVRENDLGMDLDTTPKVQIEIQKIKKTSKK